MSDVLDMKNRVDKTLDGGYNIQPSYQEKALGQSQRKEEKGNLGF